MQIYKWVVNITLTKGFRIREQWLATGNIHSHNSRLMHWDWEMSLSLLQDYEVDSADNRKGRSRESHLKLCVCVWASGNHTDMHRLRCSYESLEWFKEGRISHTVSDCTVLLFCLLFFISKGWKLNQEFTEIYLSLSITKKKLCL